MVMHPATTKSLSVDSSRSFTPSATQYTSFKWGYLSLMASLYSCTFSLDRFRSTQPYQWLRRILTRTILPNFNHKPRGVAVKPNSWQSTNSWHEVLLYMRTSPRTGCLTWKHSWMSGPNLSLLQRDYPSIVTVWGILVVVWLEQPVKSIEQSIIKSSGSNKTLIITSAEQPVSWRLLR